LCLQKEKVLTRNDKNNLIGSGGCGYVSGMPHQSKIDKGYVNLNQMWGLSESQETVGVSPQMFGEFIWPYQKPLMEYFGLTYYGCCEPVEDRFEYVKNSDNLRALSVSPWSNIDKCVELYADNYVMYRKPNPSLICVGFEEEQIRKDLASTLNKTKGLNIAFVLKDTHTISNEPERFNRWVKIVREEIDKVYA
jgi:hypothetical protein